MENKSYVITAYALVYLIWSTTYLAVKTGVSTIPVFFLVGARWFFSGVFLTVIGFIIYKKDFIKGITKKQVMNSIFISLLILGITNLLFSESMKTLDSYLAAVMNATVPLFLTIFDFFINGIKFKKSTLFAIFLGILGIAVLVYKGSFKLAYDFHIFTLLASISIFTFGAALSRKLELPKNTVFNSTLQMYFAGILCFFIYFLSGNTVSISGISFNSWLALVYLITFGGIGMLAYIYLIKHEPLSRVSSYVFVNAIGATLLGLFIGEKLSVNFFIAAPMIFVALMIILKSRAQAEHLEVEGHA
jgi:drug/metabolite transporter (DMT)-like permease